MTLAKFNAAYVAGSRALIRYRDPQGYLFSGYISEGVKGKGAEAHVITGAFRIPLSWIDEVEVRA
tara:strand:- start:735 stop:929 length:195 start_codon:yes stop_codon:yes gene_type:complete